MTTVTVHPTEPLTPSQQVVAKAGAAVQVIDARGRKITLKRPPVLRQFKLIEMLGASAANGTYVSMVLPLIFIQDFDGHPAVMGSKAELEILIGRLDQDGINAVLKGVEEHFGQSDPEADREALGK